MAAKIEVPQLTRWEVRISWAQAMRQLYAQPSNGFITERAFDTGPLISPVDLHKNISASSKSRETVQKGIHDARAIINGKDDRLLVIVGPCSIHDPDAALEYGKNLREVANRLEPYLCIIMRAYVEKPRSTIGWKGLAHDPDLDGSARLNEGLVQSRQLYADLTELGLPVASELLDLVTPASLVDLISIGAIGARTTESQPHRELASAMPFPVGFKNSPDGNVVAALNGLRAARVPHIFRAMTLHGARRVESRGNTDCFVILRGGDSGPNYDQAAVQKTHRQLATAHGPQHPGIVIDCSHGNSRKDFRRQQEVVNAVGRQIASGENSLVGVMIESNMHEGRQDIPLEGPAGLRRGVSITDGCLGWDDTVTCLQTLADAVLFRREIKMYC